MLDPLLTEHQVSDIIGRAVPTLQKDRSEGNSSVIPYIKIGRLVRYRQSDIEAYLAALPARRSTSEGGESQPQRRRLRKALAGQPRAGA
jgi:predicted DNA-binding transcriptional regulator AlpA